jgi:hypothetical protein
MILLDIIGYAALGHIIVDFINHLDLPEIPNKPFKCDMCFTTWYSILPLVLEYGLKGFIYAGLAGVTADLIFRIKNRI